MQSPLAHYALICGAFAGFGILVALNSLPSERAAIASLIFAPPIALVAGGLLQRSKKVIPKISGGLLFVLGAVMSGSSLGFLALSIVRPRGPDDFGPLYSLCGLGALLGTGTVFRRSGHRLLSRLGTIMIVLASLTATWTVEVFSKYSYFATRMNLGGAEKALLGGAGIALLVVIPAATAVMLGRPAVSVRPLIRKQQG